MRGWATLTRVAINRSLWRAMRGSGWSRGMLSCNALRAQLVLGAEEWRWSSLWRHVHGTEEGCLLATWPIGRPPDWVERVNLTDDESELESLRQSIHRERPFGRPEWQKPIAKRLGLKSDYRPSGRRPKTGPFESGPKTGSKAHHQTYLTRTVLQVTSPQFIPHPEDGRTRERIRHWIC